MKTSKGNPLKIILGIAGAFAASFVASPSAYAVSLASDNFNTYPDGSLSGNNGGTGFNGAWTGTYTLVSGVAYNAASGSGFNTSPRTLGTTAIAAFASGNTVWLSYDFRDTAGNFGLLSFFSSANTEVLSIGQVNTGNVWGMLGNGATTVSSTVSDTTLKTGVIKLTINTGATSTANLWVGTGVGPVDVSAMPNATITGLTLTNVQYIRLGSNPNNAAPVIATDDIRLGTTMGDVNAVPEPTTWAMMLGGFGIAAMVRRVRARRA